MAKEMDIKFAITSSAIKALDYKKSKPNADIEEIMKAVFINARGSSDAKKGVVVGVSKAVKYLEENPAANTKSIMQRIMNELNEIVVSLKEED
jgi:RNase H-fold protein (predicted Holliday junction resolvase)